MEIALAESDAAIRAAFSVMRHLRDLPSEDAFVDRVSLQRASGYRLAVLVSEGRARAVAGFRIGENLAWGRFLYVDDLVTDPDARSRGFGKAMLEWLVDHARQEGCGELHLDSGNHRVDAHRFYEREGLGASSLHFRRDL